MGEGGLFLSPGVEKNFYVKEYRFIMKLLEYLKEHYEYKQLSNALRFNNVIDIFIKKKTGKITICNVPTQEWIYPADEEEAAEYAIAHLDFYTRNPHLIKSGKPLEDTDEITFGKHRGEKLGSIPAGYFIYLLDNCDIRGRLYDYIKKNEKRLRTDAKLEKKGIK
jgi:hypothetical protein